jgi:hypothetical protein
MKCEQVTCGNEKCVDYSRSLHATNKRKVDLHVATNARDEIFIFSVVKSAVLHYSTTSQFAVHYFQKLK